MGVEAGRRGEARKYRLRKSGFFSILIEGSLLRFISSFGMTQKRGGMAP